MDAVTDASLFEEIFEGKGKEGIIIKYSNEESGILSCSGEAKSVIFHVNQVWVYHNGSGWSQFRELYPTMELKGMFPVKSRIRCNIRRVDAGDKKFQATVVWQEGAPSAPSDYKTKDLLEDLKRLAS